MPTKYDAVHFDMDGVIADTEPFHILAEQQTCRDYDFDIDPNKWGGFKGRTSKDIFTYLINNYGDPNSHKPEQLIAHKTDIFLDIISSELVAISGVLDFISWCREEHEYISLVTSSNRRVQSYITDSFEITNMFDLIITGDDINEGKPSPEPYLRALGGLGVDAKKSLVIEDSKSGIFSAQAAGCNVMAITTSHTREELATACPTYIADDYTNAKKIITI